MPLKWDETEKLVKRIEDTGCPVLVWTVDLLAGRNTPTMTRFARQDTRNCIACHPGAGAPSPADVRRARGPLQPARCHVGDLRSPEERSRGMKVHAERHRQRRGRAACGGTWRGWPHRLEPRWTRCRNLTATIDCLPSGRSGAGRIPVFLDGGVRRGTDIYKALALRREWRRHRTPVHLGPLGVRPGRRRARAGDPRAELTLTMRQMGTPTIKDIAQAHASCTCPWMPRGPGELSKR